MQAEQLPERCIYQFGNAMFNARVRGIQQIRRENLRQIILDEFDGSQGKFAAAMGFEQPNLVSRLLSTGKSAKNIGDKLARKIERVAKKPEFWMDHSEQQARMQLPDYNVEAAPDFHRLTPLISWVQAGNWYDLIDNFQPGDAEEWFPCPVRCSRATFVLRVRGASMEPKFRDGELIFVDPEAEARNKSFVIVRIENSKEGTFKQLIIEGERRYLKPLNPQWPDPIIEMDDSATICGVVIFHGERV